ncbi:MAG: DUF3885 domain-containing protein [Treponema sp.]|nr:DUF3885 domain-containing protein [Treponema sp.]
MKNKYKNVILKQSIFYDYKYALRVDLHDININKDSDEYFIESLNRAKELFYKIFYDNGELYFIYRNRKIKFTDKIFSNISKLNKNEIGILYENGIYEEKFKTSLAVIKLDINRINYENILESINNTDFASREPRTDGEVYFIHIMNEIIFNMYDDRGLDIVGTNKKAIEPFYRKYNKWLLDYDREKMDKTFK